MKILLISGHGANDPGACSSYGIEREETRRVVNRLSSILSAYAEVTVYPQSHNCYADVCNGNVALNVSAFDYVFEVHFNSGVPEAHGTEIWVTPQESGSSVEQGIVNKVASIGFTNRGVKSERFAVINYCKNQGVSSALIETCFISNQQDMVTYNSKFEQIAQAMVDGILEGFGIKKSVVANNATTQSAQQDFKGDDVMFSSNWYLTRYKDVANSKTYKDNPYQHYIDFGKKEGRLPLPTIPANFCEGDYLELNPDVAAAVKKCTFTSGYEHFCLYGFNENRKINKNESDADLKARIKELEDKINKVKDAVK